MVGSRGVAAGISLAAALCAGLAILAAGCAAPGVTMPPDSGEWRWEGRIRVDRFIEVPAAVTLRIMPGTRLEFVYEDRDGDGHGDNGLHVRGRVVAAGEAGAPIVFTSAEGKPRPGDWRGLLLDNSRGSHFAHCTFSYARHAFHAHFSEGLITASRLLDNIEGTRLGDSRFEISHSLIARNVSKGLNFRACANYIHHNRITGNGHGIFLFETDTESRIEENDIFGNENYNLRLGDFYRGGLALKGNWWGSADGAVIAEGIYEGDGEGERGRVKIAPAAAPVSSAGEGE
jgi:parallel beta-helix repeat protein